MILSPVLSVSALIAAGALSCIAIDGDTIRCGPEHIRLLAIDAPEVAGHCRPGRKCVEGDAGAATRSLREGMQRGTIRIERVGRDAYGRTLATVTAGGVDLSCWQLRRGAAVYVQRWDNGGRIARLCPPGR